MPDVARHETKFARTRHATFQAHSHFQEQGLTTILNWCVENGLCRGYTDGLPQPHPGKLFAVTTFYDNAVQTILAGCR